VPAAAETGFQYTTFDSLSVKGNNIFGMDCNIYSNINCENTVTDTGNHVSDNAQCINVQGAQSMRCFYDC
ncbi:hypothetical protein B0H19DRAFT_963754, partial [Mycena capillaripes]